MESNISLKRQITDKVAEHRNIPYKVAWMQIWQNTHRKDTSYRLRPEGFIALTKELDLEKWPIKSRVPDLRHLRAFEMTLNCPYYLTPQGMFVFSEEEAVLLSLYTDNLDIYFGLKR